MKNKILLIIIGAIAFIGQAQVSQNYKQIAKESEANYYTIVTQARQEFSEMDLSIRKNSQAKKQFERWVFYWQPRVNADGTFPNELQGYYNAGILSNTGELQKPFIAKSTQSNESWTNVGPAQADLNNNGYTNYPQMGRLNTLLRIKHPTTRSQDVLLVGAPDGGIWKSNDGGATWAPKLDFAAGIGVTDIRTVPGTTTANYLTRPIYVSTGDYDGQQSKSIGVLKSTDGGETFSSTGLTYTPDQQMTMGDIIVIDANTVFVAEKQFIKKTLDGGATWTNAYDSQFANSLIGRAAFNGTEIMFTSGQEVYYTDNYNNDVNWDAYDFTSNVNKKSVTTDANGDFYTQDQSGRIRKFNKTSRTFVDFGTIPPGYDSQSGYNQALVINNSLFLTGAVRGASSTNNGATWTNTLNEAWTGPTDSGVYVHSDHHRMGQLDTDLEFWSVNDGGLNYVTYASTTDIKPTTTYLSSNVIVTQSYSIAINPSANDDSYLMSNQDNDAFSKRNGSWYAVNLGDGIQSAINYNNADIRYASDQNGGIVQTNTGFQGQLNGNGNFVSVPSASFYFPLEMNKTNPNFLYAGSNDVYKIDATNAMNLTISPTNSGLTDLISIATHGNAIMAASFSSIKFSSNGGTTWTSIGLPTGTSGEISSVDFDGTNNNNMYVTYSGYNNNSKVFKTTNGGTSWTNISSNLPNIVTYEVMLKQNQSSEYLFLATELGVYFTNNSGTSWSRLGQGLPNVNIRDIEIHYTADKLVAGSFGRGLWEINIANSTLSSDSIDAPTVEVTVYPNPTSDLLNVKIADSKQYNYVMYNVVGGIVKKGTISDKGIDVSELAQNMYLLRVYNDATSVTKKVIIE
ncbi:putative secreted protein (Por secretion system target) [Nonlabens dokdonensis]|uniref:Glycosyl hydrolase n=2 Tax=Nonlabens dokdonensis TaxID=328515 RepID=L7W5D9_NONDD|nr:T9SS type A sorting domain-containing protein [Nonlabens dokdonensis]AGC75392.1 glycosyl hydrolase [Nonlabens dokdonensis DSW-6]PZX43091.1 putative secreted protein (Por secretion system target) [Nonlabens dokdonensis]